MFFAANAWGQAAPSPFTDFGIGEAYGNSLIHNQGAGGLGVSQPQIWFLNNQNPALLVFNPIFSPSAALMIWQPASNCAVYKCVG